VYRLYSQANLAVRRRKKLKRPASERVPLQMACNVNEVWSMVSMPHQFSPVWPE
jgi:putative transposase